MHPIWDENLATAFSNAMLWRREIGNIHGDVNSLNNNLIGTILTVTSDLGIRKNVSYDNKRNSKPWFDAECKSLKKTIKNKLKDCKTTNFSNESKNEYSSLRNQFKNLT